MIALLALALIDARGDYSHFVRENGKTFVVYGEFVEIKPYKVTMPRIEPIGGFAWEAESAKRKGLSAPARTNEITIERKFVERSRAQL